MDQQAMALFIAALSKFTAIPPNEEDNESALLVFPRTGDIKSLEEFQKAPNRTKTSTSLASCQSFCDYVNRFKQAETSVYLNIDDGKFAAIIDHHGTSNTSWRDHRATFAPEHSLQWQAWLLLHKQTLGQLQFSEFIEDNLLDIHDPEANVVLQSALAFQANEKMMMSSAQNLDDGNIQFHFTKENTSNDVTFPHRIKIRMPVFENEANIDVEARIRYRVSGEGVLTFKFAFVTSPELIVRRELVRIAGLIYDKCGDTNLYEGTASK